MRTLTRLVLVATSSMLLGSCASGPHQLRRSVDDWDQKIYVNSPWLNAGMWLVGIYPVCHAGAIAFDFILTDPYHFWFEDAWDGNGTGYRHLEIDWTDGWTDCLFSDRSRWTRSDK